MFAQQKYISILFFAAGLIYSPIVTAQTTLNVDGVSAKSVFDNVPGATASTVDDSFDDVVGSTTTKTSSSLGVTCSMSTQAGRDQVGPGEASYSCSIRLPISGVVAQTLFNSKPGSGTVSSERDDYLTTQYTEKSFGNGVACTQEIDSDIHSPKPTGIEYYCGSLSLDPNSLVSDAGLNPPANVPKDAQTHQALVKSQNNSSPAASGDAPAVHVGHF
jgi:hypothetical protein